MGCRSRIQWTKVSTEKYKSACPRPYGREAVEYLVSRPFPIFKFRIKSTGEMFNGTEGDGSCGYKAVWQALQCARISFTGIEDAPVGVDYSDAAGRLEKIRWVEGLLVNLPILANQARLCTYIRLFRLSLSPTTHKFNILKLKYFIFIGLMVSL